MSALHCQFVKHGRAEPRAVPRDGPDRQQTVGNRATGGLVTRPSGQRPVIQAKLTVNAPGDEYEREADRVALRVGEQVRMSPREPPSPSVRREHGRENDNTTGIPDPLKAGIECLSGLSLADVKVHYNSSQPAQLQALAYTQGTDIHVGPGQEKHLVHEAWHVVQQKQGRVRPTLQIKDRVAINDDAGLEKEADVMGTKALQMGRLDHIDSAARTATAVQRGGETRDASEVAGAAIVGSEEKARLNFPSTVQRKIMHGLMELTSVSTVLGVIKNELYQHLREREMVIGGGQLPNKWTLERSTYYKELVLTIEKMGRNPEETFTISTESFGLTQSSKYKVAEQVLDRMPVLHAAYEAAKSARTTEAAAAAAKAAAEKEKALGPKLGSLLTTIEFGFNFPKDHLTTTVEGAKTKTEARAGLCGGRARGPAPALRGRRTGGALGGEPAAGGHRQLPRGTRAQPLAHGHPSLSGGEGGRGLPRGAVRYHGARGSWSMTWSPSISAIGMTC